MGKYDFWIQGGGSKTLVLWALKSKSSKNLVFYKNRNIQRLAKIFSVEFQRFPVKFHSKYIAYTLKGVHFRFED